MWYYGSVERWVNSHTIIGDSDQPAGVLLYQKTRRGKNMGTPRPDRDGTHRGVFERNKRKIYATQTVCGICGKPVDFSKKYPNPLSPCIDHIIPISKGGHPSDINNLQLAHWYCNRQKSDKLFNNNFKKNIRNANVGNRNLPHSVDWKSLK